MTLYAYVDGASRGNPGEAGIGIILKNPNGTTLFSTSGIIGNTTNNVAEYIAVREAIRHAAFFPCTELKIHSDSELITNQILGTYKIKQPHLRALNSEVRSFIKKAPFSVTIIHIPRELNRDADKLVNKGLDDRTPYITNLP